MAGVARSLLSGVLSPISIRDCRYNVVSCGHTHPISLNRVHSNHNNNHNRNHSNQASIPRAPNLFVCVTSHDGPQLADRHRSCPAAKAATTALVVATRAAVDRCGHVDTTQPYGDRRRPGLEVHFTATIRANPPLQAAGAEYFAFDVEDVPAASPAGALQRLRRRAQRRAARVGHGPCARSGAQDRSVPLRADPRCSSAAGSRPAGGGLPCRSSMLPSAEQVIEETKIWSPTRRSRRRTVFLSTQTAEQVVEVPELVQFASSAPAVDR